MSGLRYLDLTKWTSLLLVRLGDQTRNLFTNYLATVHLQPKHYGILFVLWDQEPLSQVEIGQQVEVDRALMVHLIDHLENLALVERTPNPHDRRAHAIRLTDKGREILAQANKLAERVETEILAPLSVEERQQLNNLLNRLREFHER